MTIAFFHNGGSFSVDSGRSNGEENAEIYEDSNPEKTKKLRNMVCKKLKGKY